MVNILLYDKLTSLPDNLKAEVEDFIDYLKTKSKKSKELKELKKPIKPKFGSGKGLLNMKPDFEDPLEDFKRYME